jgi:hypothetical protein
MAKHLPLREGPFPIYHPDFRHSNFIIDKDYNILSIIDWENASSVPWEVVEFPLFLSATPAPMDAPWNYDEFGRPIDPSTAELWEGRDEYVLRVREAEVINGLDQRLSNVLADRTSQDLAGALKLYVDPGKIGFYCRVLDSMVAASSTTKGDQDNLDGAPPTNAGGISF